MVDLSYLPMGLMWHMPVPVACSLAIAGGGLAVTCGQCPLDREGRVMDPDDPAAQAGRIADAMRAVLAHLPSGYRAALMVVYHDAPDADDVLSPLSRAFPAASLVPVRLPHFYYPGMRIEVDLYAIGSEPLTEVRQDGDGRLALIGGGPLTLAGLSAPDMATAARLLGGLDARRLLSAQWFAADAPPADWTPAPASRVLLPASVVRAVLTLADGPVSQTLTPGGAILRQSGDFAWMSAHGTDPDLALSAHQAMDLLALPDMPGLTVLKATTHYAGGPGPEALHGNLAVRHARFPQPGPASTGVPVAGLAGASLAIDMLARIDSAVVSAYRPR